MPSLFLAELGRYWIQYRRYPMDVLGNLVVLTGSFYALLIGSRYVAGPGAQFGERVDSIIIGYWLWTVLIFALIGMAGELQSEALTGTLEQLSLSGYGLTRIMLSRALATLWFNVFNTSLMLGAMLLLTGRRLSFPPPALLPLLVVVLGSYGLSLGLGALALLFKRVQQLVQVSHFLFLALVVMPIESWHGAPWLLAQLLPVAPAAALLRGLMARGEALDWAAFAAAAINGAAYLAAGIWLFARADRKARQRALLGQY